VISQQQQQQGWTLLLLLVGVVVVVVVEDSSRQAGFMTALTATSCNTIQQLDPLLLLSRVP
jgi:hypothetical protein